MVQDNILLQIRQSEGTVEFILSNFRIGNQGPWKD